MFMYIKADCFYNFGGDLISNSTQKMCIHEKKNTVKYNISASVSSAFLMNSKVVRLMKRYGI